MNWLYSSSSERQDTAGARQRATPVVAPSPPVTTDKDPSGTRSASGAGHRLANISIAAPPAAETVRRPPIQPKLTVSQPDDPYEQEADRVAESVMGMPEASASGAQPPPPGRPRVAARPVGDRITPWVQRQTAGAEEEQEDEAPGPTETVATKPVDGNPLQRQADAEEPEQPPEEQPEQESEQSAPVQAKRSGRAPPVSPVLETSLNRTQGQGAALPTGPRRFFEPRFGHDFSRVRIHADGAAAQAAHHLNAQAFTRGADIYFGAGRYQPQSTSGRQLLAHELTHVVQQGAGQSAAAVQRQEEVPGFSPEEVEEYGTEDTGITEDTGVAARAEAGGGSGPAINRPGMMSCTPGSPTAQYLRKQPVPDKGDNVLATLAFNDIVFVDQSGGAGGKWYQITTATGQQGWVPVVSVALDPPEPTASLYRIKAGDTPIDLAGTWYGPFEKWWWPGSSDAGDARFYVAALAYANKGRAGMPSPDSLDNMSSWKSVTLIADHTVWRPGKPFLDTLKGKVSSGSISRTVWEGVKSAAKMVWGWAVYAAAFVSGILYGAGESIYDLLVGIVDLVKMLYAIGKSLILGNIISDAMALWEDLKKLSLADMEKWFLGKWNAEDPWDQGFFRGRVLGYIAMEIIMLVFSDGILTAIKWAGKFAKIGELIAKLPRLAKLAEAAKGLKVPAKIKEALKLRWAGKGGKGTRIITAIEKAKPAINAVLKSAEHIAKRAAAWQKYTGKKSKAVFEAMYDTLTRNRLVGKLAEKEFATVMGGASKSYWVRVGGKDVIRYVDNVLGSVAREVKSGPLKLTPFIKQQILKDMQLMATKGLQVEWHLLAGGDAKAIAALQKAGIKVIIY